MKIEMAGHWIAVSAESTADAFGTMAESIQFSTVVAFDLANCLDFVHVLHLDSAISDGTSGGRVEATTKFDGILMTVDVSLKFILFYIPKSIRRQIVFIPFSLD